MGEGDRIKNETFGTLIQKNGTFNVGLGTITVNSATISGGAFNIDRGGTFNAVTLALLPGSQDLNVTTGLTGGAQTVLQIGSGGTSLSGQNIILGTGFSGNTMGAAPCSGSAGNVTYTGSDLVGGSYGRKGIFIQTRQHLPRVRQQPDRSDGRHARLQYRQRQHLHRSRRR